MSSLGSHHGDALLLIAAVDGQIHHGDGIVRVADDALVPAVEGQLLAALQIFAGALPLGLKVPSGADKCPYNIFPVLLLEAEILLENLLHPSPGRCAPC